LRAKPKLSAVHNWPAGVMLCMDVLGAQLRFNSIVKFFVLFLDRTFARKTTSYRIRSTIAVKRIIVALKILTRDVCIGVKSLANLKRSLTVWFATVWMIWNQVNLVCLNHKGWTTIFVRGPHCAFLGTFWARLQSKKVNLKLKIWSSRAVCDPWAVCCPLLFYNHKKGYVSCFGFASSLFRYFKNL
jgi:hypothetical protein